MASCISCNDKTPLPKTGKDCGIENENPLYDVGNCSVDENGVPIVTPTNPNDNSSSCVKQPNGTLCPPEDTCSPFDLTESNEACLISSLIGESLNIGASVINVHRLLGVHEQGLLQDITGAGEAISNGDLPNYPAKNAFDKYITEWRSSQIGNEVLQSAYIGYDFGPIRLDNNRLRYGIETAIKHNVSTINIKQGCNSSNRVTKVRIERSNDGEKWFGVASLNVPDCDGMVKLQFKASVPSRYWRVRPTQFNGGSDDYWSIQALQFMDYEATTINNIQDKIWMENRDKDYDEQAVKIKGAYTPIDVVSNQSKFGFLQDMDTYSIEVSFTQAVAILGRPFIIGDIIQLPSETQYRPDLTPVLKYLEITDVAWSVNGYTPTWVPTMQRLMARPAMATQETQDLFGKLTPDVDNTGLMDLYDGNNTVYQDYAPIDQTIKAEGNTRVPERGEDNADIQKFSDELLEFSDAHPHMNLRKFDKKRTGYNIDAMPPNGLPYTEGDEYPPNPKNGDYHRLTYEKIGKGHAPRLMRYSEAKGYWIYLETDRRYEHNNAKPTLAEFTNPETSSVTPVDKIGDDI